MVLTNPWFPATRLRNLTREARDTLFLLGVIGWTVAPHMSHMPVWCSVLTGLVLLWRAQLAVVDGPLPHRGLLVSVLALASGLCLWEFHTLLGREAGITMAVVLMALKMMELRARRDAFVVFFLGFFLVLTHFLYSQSLLIAASMLVSVWGLLTALVLAHMPAGQPNLRQAAGISAKAAIVGAPMMLLLFFLFPRIGPLWGGPGGAGMTGLSNSMSMGTIAELAQDDSVAMRLKFAGIVPPPETLYFRGPVLSYFNGHDWSPAVPTFQTMLSGEPAARAPSMPPGMREPKLIHYEMTVEPTKLEVIPTLEATVRRVPIENHNVLASDALQWVTDRPVVERIRFEADAMARFTYGPTEAAGAELTKFTALPVGFNPRTLAWAEDLRRAHAEASPSVLVAVVMDHIRNGGFTYTLAPGLYGEDHPGAEIDEFWLDRKQGFCEHFASAFVVIMRAMGVPARVVTGYQGADPFPVDGYYVVRQSSAHAWAEYWERGRGWVRADPTAAVAPDRIMRNQKLAPKLGFMASALDSMSPALLGGWRNGWETVNNRWNQWILSYSRGDQMNLLKHLGFETPDWGDLLEMLVDVLCGGAILAVIVTAWDRRRTDPWSRTMSGVRRELERAGMSAGAHEAPGVLASRLRLRLGTPADPAAALLEELERQRYSQQARGRPDRGWMRQFKREVRQLYRPSSRLRPAHPRPGALDVR